MVYQILDIFLIIDIIRGYDLKGEKMKTVYRYIILFFIVILAGPFVALTIKAGVGVAAWDAFNQTNAGLFNTKIGTMVFLTNSICVLIQILIYKKEFRKIQLLQLLVSFIMGMLINLSFYNIFTFEFSVYYQRFITFILSTVAVAFLVGAIMSLDIISFPLEGMCKAISDKSNLSFVKLRFGFDIFGILVALTVPLFTGQTVAIREGTIIGMLLFSPLLGFFMPIQKQFIEKYLK